MKIVKKFNGLNGSVVSRQKIVKMIAEANQHEQFHLAKRLESVLTAYPDEELEFNIESPEIEAAPISILDCLDCDQNPGDEAGLGKAVSPTEIYDMITNKIISVLEQPLDFKMEWGSFEDSEGGYLIGYNFDSKKPYRGINSLMLNSFKLYDPKAPLLRNPYYLTFKQIEDHKGKIIKGRKGHQVIYFMNLYKLELPDKKLYFTSADRGKVKQYATKHGVNHGLIAEIPVLKYYVVFNGADIEGIDFNLANFSGRGKVEAAKKVDNQNLERIPAAEAIIKAYPQPSPEIKFGGDDAFYNRAGDYIQIPKLEQFNYVQAYYTTIFHEQIHSTGSPTRLDRVKGKKFGDKDYSFEELIAEIGASFLSAEAGVLHYTFRNSAAYIKSWRKVLLTHIKDDNKFFFRAASQAQKAVDFMLDRDANGVPAYEKSVKIPVPKKRAVTRKVVKSESNPTVVDQSPKLPILKGKYLMPNPEFEHENIASKWLDNNLPTALKYKLAVLLLSQTKNPDDVLGINDMLQYNRLLRILDTIADSKNEMAWRLENYSTADAENWTRKSLAEIFTLTNKRPVKKTAALNAPEIISDPVQPEITVLETEVKPIVTIPKQNVVKGSLADRRRQPKEPQEYYKFTNPDIKEFLGEVEIKKRESVVITVTGGQGSMKTRFLFQLMNDLGQNYKCGHASNEEHPDSALYRSKEDQYLNDRALNNISAPEIDSIAELDQLINANDVILIDSFTKFQEMERGFEVDKDLRKKYHGKLFIIIFQLTSDGKMRGGAKSQFDGDIISYVEKCPDYKNNYAYQDKNRYNSLPLDQLKFNIFSGKLIRNKPDPVAETPIQSIAPKFSFQVIEK